jgi:lysozyme family protein
MSTGGEIPRDITEMMKSSLNSIGGNIVYIPYDPAFIQNQMVTGYSGFENKLIPDVILTGGITEFDRGLETRGENTDASLGGEIEKGVPSWLPSQNVGLKYGGADKAGLARISLDFNLIDFQTMSGISKMNTVNTMEVRKAVSGKELGISLFGQTFGLKGSIKKVQGRHAAVRLLVELSMIQIVGKHLVIPYWNLLGEEALPDKVVMKALAKYYYSLNDATAVASVQEWLYLYGYDVPQDGVIDASTQQALSELNQSFDAAAGKIGLDTFRNVYINIPITQETLGRRGMLARLYEGQPQEEVAAVESAEEPAEVYQEEQPVEQVQAVEAEPVPVAEKAAPVVKKTTRKRGKIGRILSDEEW